LSRRYCDVVWWCFDGCHPLMVFTACPMTTVARKRQLLRRRSVYYKNHRRHRKVVGDVGERVLRSTPDWGETAANGDHLWVPTSVSGDFCYIGDMDCTKHGARMKCSACNVVAHQNCIGILMDKMRFTCKPTFRDVGVRQYREQTSIHHHWVHRRSEKGKCRQCGKVRRRK
jgi:hypothetical protein